MKRGMIFFITAVLLSIAGCSNTLFDSLGDFALYSVTYVADGSEAGIVPVDPAGYEQGMTFPVPGNTGNLARNAFVFSGWNILANGNGTNYTQGQTFIMSAANVTLYARWSANIARVSVATDGTEGDGNSSNSSISSDGRYVAFYSVATNLVAGDTNGFSDIFVHNRDADGNGVFETGAGKTAITLVSISSSDGMGNDNSYNPSISSDGRYVAFESFATNIAGAEDTNGSQDIFVHDRDADGNGIFDETGNMTTTRVSVATDGTEGDDPSYNPSISSDGRYVAFNSTATNLVAGDTNACMDVFVHDRQTGATTRVSVASDGTEGKDHSYNSSISSDGRYVAFYSDAKNLVAGDTNIHSDVFVHDCQTGATARISVASDGTQGNGNSPNPSISSDGRYVAFQSTAANLVAGDTNGLADVFVHDRRTGSTTRVSVSTGGTEGNGISTNSSISSDGRYVAFTSIATNLVAGDTNGLADVFVHDRLTGFTTRVSMDKDDTQGNGISSYPSISSDGRYAAFQSAATNFVTGDSNFWDDVFVAPVK